MRIEDYSPDAERYLKKESYSPNEVCDLAGFFYK